jgi:hypothetical protein
MLVHKLSKSFKRIISKILLYISAPCRTPVSCTKDTLFRSVVTHEVSVENVHGSHECASL